MPVEIKVNGIKWVSPRVELAAVIKRYVEVYGESYKATGTSLRKDVKNILAEMEARNITEQRFNRLHHKLTTS